MQFAVVQHGGDVGRRENKRVERRAGFDQLVGGRVAVEIFEDDKTPPVGQAAVGDRRSRGNALLLEQAAAGYFDVGGGWGWRRWVALDVQANFLAVGQRLIQCAVFAVGERSPDSDARIIEDGGRVEADLAEKGLIVRINLKNVGGALDHDGRNAAQV